MAHRRSGQSASRPQEEPSKIPMALNCKVLSPLLGKHPAELQRRTNKSRFLASPVLLLAQGRKKDTCPWLERGQLCRFWPRVYNNFYIFVRPLPVSCNNMSLCASDHIRKSKVGLLYCYFLTPSLLSRLP